MKDTYWFAKDGAVLCCHGGDGGRTNLHAWPQDFPISPHDVARLMNEAFRYGMEAKAAQIKHVLDIK